MYVHECMGKRGKRIPILHRYEFMWKLVAQFPAFSISILQSLEIFVVYGIIAMYRNSGSCRLSSWFSLSWYHSAYILISVRERGFRFNYASLPWVLNLFAIVCTVWSVEGNWFFPVLSSFVGFRLLMHPFNFLVVLWFQLKLSIASTSAADISWLWRVRKMALHHAIISCLSSFWNLDSFNYIPSCFIMKAENSKSDWNMRLPWNRVRVQSSSSSLVSFAS